MQRAFERFAFRFARRAFAFLYLVIQFAPVTIGVFGIGTEEVCRVGGPRPVSHEI